MNWIDGGVTAPKGFVAAGIHCGIRKNQNKKDIAMVYSASPCSAAAVYTQNLVKGAPILVTQENLKNGSARAMVCNSGNANTCNPDGYTDAKAMSAKAAAVLSLSEDEIIVASTGVIGQPLPIDTVCRGIDMLVGALSPTGGPDAAEAIMTTDLVKKQFCVELKLGGAVCRIAGMAKGSGMVNPNMATMLCFLTTDVNIAPEPLQRALSAAVAVTFNMVSVDGDTSTNDMVSVLANGAAGGEKITGEGADYESFLEALIALCTSLAREVAGDGEGATKLLECAVTGAASESDARVIAKSVISSSLVKAAFFGEDANWGRILCAIGYSGVPCDVQKIAVTLSSTAGSVAVCKDGGGLPFDEKKAKAVLSEKEIVIEVSLGGGSAGATAWGCDLTYEYVKINGDYRT